VTNAKSADSQTRESDLLNAILKRRKARESLINFTEYTYDRYNTAFHHRLIAARLEQVERREIDRLMLFVPPRHGKSELASRRFPAFCLGRDPTLQFISASAATPLAADFGRDVRNLIASPEYAALFTTRLAEDSQAKDLWRTNEGGIYVAVGTDSKIMGRGADLFLIDDPFGSFAESQRKTERDRVWNWYVSTVYNRLQPKGRIVIINHRMHEDDLSGRLLEQAQSGGDKWSVVELPAIAYQLRGHVKEASPDQTSSEAQGASRDRRLPEDEGQKASGLSLAQMAQKLNEPPSENQGKAQEPQREATQPDDRRRAEASGLDTGATSGNAQSQLAKDHADANPHADGRSEKAFAAPSEASDLNKASPDESRDNGRSSEASRPTNAQEAEGNGSAQADSAAQGKEAQATDSCYADLTGDSNPPSDDSRKLIDRNSGERTEAQTDQSELKGSVEASRTPSRAQSATPPIVGDQTNSPPLDTQVSDNAGQASDRYAADLLRALATPRDQRPDDSRKLISELADGRLRDRAMRAALPRLGIPQYDSTNSGESGKPSNVNVVEHRALLQPWATCTASPPASLGPPVTGVLRIASAASKEACSSRFSIEAWHQTAIRKI
jgi:hypothetical protein